MFLVCLIITDFLPNHSITLQNQYTCQNIRKLQEIGWEKCTIFHFLPHQLTIIKTLTFIVFTQEISEQTNNLGTIKQNYLPNILIKQLFWHIHGLIPDKCFRFGLKSTMLLWRGKPNTHLYKHVTIPQDLGKKYKEKKISEGKKWFLHCNNLHRHITGIIQVICDYINKVLSFLPLGTQKLLSF